LREGILYGAPHDSTQEILAIGKMAIEGANAQMCPCGDLVHLHLQPTFSKNGLGHLDNTRSIGHGIGASGRYFRMLHALLLPLATSYNQEDVLFLK
jgi:hypothetical protein